METIRLEKFNHDRKPKKSSFGSCGGRKEAIYQINAGTNMYDRESKNSGRVRCLNLEIRY